MCNNHTNNLIHIEITAEAFNVGLYHSDDLALHLRNKTLFYYMAVASNLPASSSVLQHMLNTNKLSSL